MRAKISIHALRVEGDRGYRPLPDTVYSISIHALRVEGDEKSERLLQNRHQLFLSTPSGWRATLDTYAEASTGKPISIHALRVEGDPFLRRTKWTKNISIHALRVEGDAAARDEYFEKTGIFLSTPSGWRATGVG